MRLGNIIDFGFSWRRSECWKTTGSGFANAAGLLRLEFDPLMRSAFEILGIDARLVIDDEAIGAAFREAGKSAHPDAGGADDEFARLREAFEVVSSPSKRLRHWLEIRGIAVEPRGVVDSSLMDLFSTVGEVTQGAEALIRRRCESKSALGLAMLESETQRCRESVEEAIRSVESAIASETAGFPELENKDAPNDRVASEMVRNLTFLEKWRAGLRGTYSRLV